MPEDLIFSSIKDETSFKVFHDLMSHRVNEVLLVCSPYDAFILEEDGSLASRIVNEYRGLNLSKPPRLTSVSTGKEALSLLQNNKYDLVITTPYVGDMDAFSLGQQVKKLKAKLPVILLAANLQQVIGESESWVKKGIDNLYLWSGSTDLFLAIIKNIEDHYNVGKDTKNAMVRVLILVEDSPVFRSSILPMLYKVVVKQTQVVLDESLNEEHLLLKMRARPKILIASSYEGAIKLYNKYKKYVFAIVSDTRYFQKKVLNDNAGINLLKYVRKNEPDMPLLLLSSNPANREKGERIPAVFLDKNDANLLDEIGWFFKNNLGFGDFVFRLPDGSEVGRAQNLYALEKSLSIIPDESFCYHADNNHFSTWFIARSEVELAYKISKTKISDFADVDSARNYLIDIIDVLRRTRQQGVVVRYGRTEFDPDIMDFVKIGSGSMGGKARGLAFMNQLLNKESDIFTKYEKVKVKIPRTCVISEEGYKNFININSLYYVKGGKDQIVTKRFLEAKLPEWLKDDLRSYLAEVEYPLAVRSSSLLEDAMYSPYAGLYKTYMLINNQDDFEERFLQLENAVKLVFASSYYAEPRAFSESVVQNRNDSMAIIIQELVGSYYGDYFYPAISGVAQSYNYYPISHMKPEDGLVHIALGFGKTVVDGEMSLRFSPRHTQIIPQFSSVEDTLKNSQRYFYALKAKNQGAEDTIKRLSLTRRELADAADEPAVIMFSSTYYPEENRIRDISGTGPKILTFNQLLKYKNLPIAEIIIDLFELGRKSMGCQVEIEFSVNLAASGEEAVFNFLQIRPMVTGEERLDVEIKKEEINRSFCFSTKSLGNGVKRDISDIVFVKPGAFDTTKTVLIARQIGEINSKIKNAKRKYLLIGEGRWGSADHSLGIPVKWHDIYAVGGMVELQNSRLNAAPSQGTHFFHNITSLGIPYLTINEVGPNDIIDWEWLNSLQAFDETEFIKHVKLESAFTVKIDGRSGEGVIYR